MPRPQTAEQVIYNYLINMIKQGNPEITFREISIETTYSSAMVRRVVTKFRAHGIIATSQTRGGRPLRYSLPN
jgi:CRP-like cAMP-binding protein